MLCSAVVSQSLPPGTVMPGTPLKERSNTEPGELATHSSTTASIHQSTGVQETDTANVLSSSFGGLTMASNPLSMPPHSVKQDLDNEVMIEGAPPDPKGNEYDYGATAVSSPPRMYTHAKAHDGPPQPAKGPLFSRYSSATCTSTSMSELQRCNTPSRDSLLQSDTVRNAMRVPLLKQNSAAVLPLGTPPRTHTFPRPGYRKRYSNISLQRSAGGLITPPTTHRCNQSLSMGHARRSLTPPATMGKLTSAPHSFDNGYESLGHGFTFHFPPSHTPVSNPSPGYDQQEVFQYPQLPPSASHHEDLEGMFMHVYCAAMSAL